MLPKPYLAEYQLLIPKRRFGIGKSQCSSSLKYLIRRRNRHIWKMEVIMRAGLVNVNILCRDVLTKREVFLRAILTKGGKYSFWHKLPKEVSNEYLISWF